MIPGIDVRAAFLRVAASARRVIAVPEVAAHWDEPSVLAQFTVRGLAGHLGRGAWVVEQYLDAGIPADAVEVGDAAGYYAAVMLTADLGDVLNTSIRERGEAEAAGGRDVVVARLDSTMARLADRLAALPGDARISAVMGATLDLDEYLVTRMVELVAHTDDLAVSVGIGSPAPDPDAATLVVHCLVDVARRRHGDRAVVLALTRRDRDVVDALRAF
jgi:hypothetical protein